MFTIASVWALIVLILGLIAIIVAYLRGEYKNSTAWFLTAFLVFLVHALL